MGLDQLLKMAPSHVRRGVSTCPLTPWRSGSWWPAREAREGRRSKHLSTADRALDGGDAALLTRGAQAAVRKRLGGWLWCDDVQCWIPGGLMMGSLDPRDNTPTRHRYPDVAKHCTGKLIIQESHPASDPAPANND